MNSIQLPLTKTAITSLRSGDVVQLNGTIFTARDAAHKRLIRQLDNGQQPPINLSNQTIYYVGPAPAKQGHVIGPAGPTTSGRMDIYTRPMLEKGVRAFIGKGYRSEEIKRALVEFEAVYFAAVGGAAALLARHIVKSEIVAYEDLGTEAIRRLEVVNFPAIVVNDIYGGDAYQNGRKQT